MKSISCYIALGSNLDNRENYLNQAILCLKEIPDIKIKKRSAIYESEPWGKTDQPNFFNCVIEIETQLTPMDLLKELQRVENQLGRVRKVKWGARTIDLDILLFGDQNIESSGLTIPHPRMLERDFVMIPLSEIAPNLVHLTAQKSIKELADRFSTDKIKKIRQLKY